jgi:hypothetical protein
MDCPGTVTGTGSEAENNNWSVRQKCILYQHNGIYHMTYQWIYDVEIIYRDS